MGVWGEDGNAYEVGKGVRLLKESNASWLLFFFFSLFFFSGSLATPEPWGHDDGGEGSYWVVEGEICEIIWHGFLPSFRSPPPKEQMLPKSGKADAVVSPVCRHRVVAGCRTATERSELEDGLSIADGRYE